jgi:Na+/H+ antiporter NhaD/arsenite permease-like protein
MPSRETRWFIPLLIVGLLVGMAFTIFLSPAIGVPLLLIALIWGAFVRMRRQASPTGRMQEFREQAVEAQEGAPVQFDERDRETLTPTQGEHSGR